MSLCVNDTGTGMAPEVIDRAFDPQCYVRGSSVVAFSPDRSLDHLVRGGRKQEGRAGSRALLAVQAHAAA